jgi:hypothetical protein
MQLRNHFRAHKVHYIKTIVTIGCVVSAVLTALWPGMALHAAACATITNLIWIWEC